MKSELSKLVPGRALGRALGRVGHPWDDIPKAGTTHSKAKITKLVPGPSSQPVLGRDHKSWDEILRSWDEFRQLGSSWDDLRRAGTSQPVAYFALARPTSVPSSWDVQQERIFQECMIFCKEMHTAIAKDALGRLATRWDVATCGVFCCGASHLRPSLVPDAPAKDFLGFIVVAMLGCTLLSCAALRRTALRCTALRRTALRYFPLRCNALHCAALHCAALHCTALHCNVLHCTAPDCAALGSAALFCAAL